jgi:RimJ/RimL family protein N-acetyltransferase
MNPNASPDLLQGNLVRLVALDAEAMSKNFSKWARDSWYGRLLSSDAAYPFSEKAIKQWWEKILEKDPPEIYEFLIRTLEDDRLIGEIGLDGVRWSHGDTYVGISIGQREDWSKGYGTDAMRIILRYAFTELNLQRVSLTVFDYNPRAVRSYEKAGFTLEGRARQRLNRDGQRYDILCMGILREEWQQNNSIR